MNTVINDSSHPQLIRYGPSGSVTMHEGFSQVSVRDIQFRFNVPAKYSHPPQPQEMTQCDKYPGGGVEVRDNTVVSPRRTDFVSHLNPDLISGSENLTD